MSAGEKSVLRAATKEVAVDATDGVDGAYFVNSPLPVIKQLPPWLDHFNARDLKILFKCSLAVWIMTIFIFIDETLRVIGQATFFGW
jgi:hypothetical protein